MTETVWFTRFDQLRRDGLTYTQALSVYVLLDGVRAFGSATIAESAMRSLMRAYGKEGGETK